jgi:hypothetical protein
MSSIATPLTHRQFGRLVGARDFARELIRDNRLHGPINEHSSKPVHSLDFCFRVV